MRFKPSQSPIRCKEYDSPFLPLGQKYGYRVNVNNATVAPYYAAWRRKLGCAGVGYALSDEERLRFERLFIALWPRISEGEDLIKEFSED